MSPRSWTVFQPNEARSPVTLFFASASLPQRKRSLSPSIFSGSTMTFALTVFSALTTLASGNSRWICSPSESPGAVKSVGGIPFEKSSGFETSTTTFRSGSPRRPRAGPRAPTRRACSGRRPRRTPRRRRRSLPTLSPGLRHPGRGLLAAGLAPAHLDLVAERGELARDRLSHHSGSENPESHDCLLPGKYAARQAADAAFDTSAAALYPSRSALLLSSSMAEHPAVNRRVVGSNPT